MVGTIRYRILLFSALLKQTSYGEVRNIRSLSIRTNLGTSTSAGESGCGSLRYKKMLRTPWSKDYHDCQEKRRVGCGACNKIRNVEESRFH